MHIFLFYFDHGMWLNPWLVLLKRNIFIFFCDILSEVMNRCLWWILFFSVIFMDPKIIHNIITLPWRYIKICFFIVPSSLYWVHLIFMVINFISSLKNFPNNFQCQQISAHLNFFFFILLLFDLSQWKVFLLFLMWFYLYSLSLKFLTGKFLK